MLKLNTLLYFDTGVLQNMRTVDIRKKCMKRSVCSKKYIHITKKKNYNKNKRPVTSCTLLFGSVVFYIAEHLFFVKGCHDR